MAGTWCDSWRCPVQSQKLDFDDPFGFLSKSEYSVILWYTTAQGVHSGEAEERLLCHPVCRVTGVVGKGSTALGSSNMPPAHRKTQAGQQGNLCNSIACGFWVPTAAMSCALDCCLSVQSCSQEGCSCISLSRTWVSFLVRISGGGADRLLHWDRC